jgi:AraC-like DNA-binding protein
MGKKVVLNTDSLPGADDAAKLGMLDEYRVWDFECSAGPFQAHIEAKMFAGIEVMRVRGSLINCTRGRCQIAADNDDRVMLTTSLTSARGLTVQNGREAELDGGFVAVSLAEPAYLALSSPINHWIRIAMPSRPLIVRAPQVEDMMSRRLDDSRGALRLLFAYAAFALDNDDLGEGASGELAANHCNDLAALAFGAGDDEAEVASGRGLRAVRLGRVLGQIRRGYAAPDLSAERIGRELGLSERYVHRLLQESGHSFSERVLAIRLEAAREALRRDPSQRIADTAYAAGFSDLSYFNRCFRRRFDRTPRDARAEAVRAWRQEDARGGAGSELVARRG